MKNLNGYVHCGDAHSWITPTLRRHTFPDWTYTAETHIPGLDIYCGDAHSWIGHIPRRHTFLDWTYTSETHIPGLDIYRGDARRASLQWMTTPRYLSVHIVHQ